MYALRQADLARIEVHVAAADPLSRAGTVSQLRGARGVLLVEEERLGSGGVALVVADQVDAETTGSIRGLRRRGVERVVLLVTQLDDKGLLAAVEAGVSGVLRRSQATPHNLLTAIRSVAAGDGALPPDMLGRLLEQVGQRLFYSERTVKNIIHDVTSRLDLRNRTHAVAYAIKQGLI